MKKSNKEIDEKEEEVTVSNKLLLSIFSRIDKLEETNKLLVNENIKLTREIKNLRSEMKSRVALYQEEMQQQFEHEALTRHDEIQEIKTILQLPSFYGENIINDLALMQQAKEQSLNSYNPIRKQLLKRLNRYSISQHPFALNLVTQELKHNPAYQEELLLIVYQSRDDETITQASVNSMTLLKAADFCFAGKDFRRVRIPGVNLSNTMLMQTDFTGADLTGVDFSESHLNGACFEEAILGDVCLERGLRLRLKDSVMAMAYGKDKNERVTLVVAAGNFLILYDAKTWEVRRVFEGHSKKIHCLAYSPDGLQIASGEDNAIKLWEVESGFCKQTFEQQHYISALAYSPSGLQIAAGDNSLIKLWTVASGICEMTLKGHESTVRALAYSPDGQQLASGDDSSLRLWTVKSGCYEKKLQPFMSQVRAIAYSPDGQQLAVGCASRIRLWGVQSKSCYTDKTLFGHSGLVYSLAYAPDGQQLASSGGNHTIKLWNPHSGSCGKTLFGHARAVTAIAYSPDGQQLASSSNDATVKLWNITSDSCGKNLATQSLIRSLAYSPNGQQLASGSMEDKTIKLWSVQSGACEKTLMGGSEVFIYSPDGQQIVSGNGNSATLLWSTQFGSCDRILSKEHSFALAYSPNSQQIASVTNNHTIQLWGAQSGSCDKTLVGHKGWVKALAYSPNGRQIASGDWRENVIKLWDVQSGSCDNTLSGHTYSIHAVIYSPNGQQIASAGGEIRLWNVKSGLCEKTFSVTSYVLAYSPDGQHLASGNSDGTVKLWSVATGECLANFTLTFSDEYYRIGALRFTFCTTPREFPRQLGDLQIGLFHKTYNYVFSFTMRWEANTKTFTLIQAPALIFHLSCSQLDLTGAMGLSQSNRELLEQYGATGKPSDQPLLPKKQSQVFSPSNNPRSFLPFKEKKYFSGTAYQEDLIERDDSYDCQN